MTQAVSSMKVCVISSYPPTHCGMANYVRLLCEGLIDEGIKISVLANDEAQKVGRAKVEANVIIPDVFGW